MDEMNVMNEEVMDNASEVVTDLVVSSGVDGKTVGIIAGATFIAGIIVGKVARPIGRKIKSIITKRKKRDDDDFFDDVEFEEVNDVQEETEETA